MRWRRKEAKTGKEDELLMSRPWRWDWAGEEDSSNSPRRKKQPIKKNVEKTELKSQWLGDLPNRYWINRFPSLDRLVSRPADPTLRRLKWVNLQ